MLGPGPRTDGNLQDARINNYYGLALDSHGTSLYVADASNNAVRAIDLVRGVVSTLGTGVSGATNGPIASAKFSAPCGVLCYGDSIYVADTTNNLVRQIVNGTVSTFVGKLGSSARIDGPIGVATLINPYAVVMTPQGVMYIAETYQSVIRKVDLDGTVSTIGGQSPGFADGPSATARFSGPYGLATDEDGNIFVADTYNNRIRVIDAATGVVSTIAGAATSGYVDGVGTNARFSSPTSVYYDGNGSLYVADYGNGRIRHLHFDR